MYEIPTTITVNEQEYPIRCNGDYRMVLDCFSCLNDVELTEQERGIACLMIFYEDFNEIEDFAGIPSETITELTQKMYKFFECEENPVHTTPFKLLDWKKDSQLIASAVNKVAQTEVRSVEYMHWWTFMGYFSEVGESVLSLVVGIRNKIKRNKKLEKYEAEFKKNNPHYFIWDSQTTEEKSEEELIKSIFGEDEE